MMMCASWSVQRVVPLFGRVAALGMVMVWPVAVAAEFPAQGLLPKEEIGALRFLKAHPEYDGRNVVVAIFDTGVDPGAPGLQTTPDGRPKIVEVIDATGSGDVDTSTVREVKEGVLRGLSGRGLRPGAEWKNPTGRYHVGMKRAYELFPGPLVGRMKEKRKEAWDERQRGLERRLRLELAAWDAAHPSPSDEEKRVRKDLEARVEQLLALQAGYEDPGPLYDCVVFHDGAAWRAVIDTDEDGELGEETLLTNYRAERRHGTLGGDAQLNYVLNILEEGKRLSIVVDSGDHGTHVAGIVAAYFPDQPELSGVAPGAQIVSVKIGDTRLGGMETATAFIRGLAAVRELKCDVINQSYGELSSSPDRGRLMELMAEIVNEDGVVFVSSAGNEGPALSTVGAPGGTSSAIIGVGAYVSPEMMAADYSIRERQPETHFVWSSRGPTLDGDWGVDISAPGAAFSPVPNWTLKRSEMMHGTSMASPNAAGGVALVLSGLKASGSPYSPYSIRRAVENSARAVPGADPFALGRGLLQVDAAYGLARTLGSNGWVEPFFAVAVPGRRGARGIYLREPEESGRVLEASVQVTPVFRKNADPRTKIGFERRFRLETSSPWVTAASHFVLVNESRNFEVRVDPTGLGPGVHAAELRGYEVGLESAGAAFRLPVVVMRPLTAGAGAEAAWREELTLGPAKLERRFFAVPAGATWAEITLEAGELEAARRLVVHTVQLRAGASATAVNHERPLTLNSQGREVVRIPVDGGRTLELCVAQSWSSLGSASFTASLAFRGIRSVGGTVTLEPGARLSRVELAADMGPARLAPKARLTARRRTVAPSDTRLRPSPAALDELTGGRRISELVLTYPFSLAEAATVLPRFPALNGRIYEGEFESQLWMILDAGRRVVAVDDGWKPGEVRLEKGDYRLKLHLRHDRTDWLEPLKTLPLVLEQQLASPIALEIYADPDQGLVQGEGWGERRLARGERAVLYVAAPTGASPGGARAGDVLVGTLDLEGVAGVPGIPLFCPVTSTPAGETAKERESDDRSREARLADARRDFRVSQLDGLMGEADAAAFAALWKELRADYPEHLPLLVKELHRIDNDTRDRRLRSVVAAADAVIAGVNTEELAEGLGARVDDEDPKARRRRAELERRRDTLVDALYRKGRALAWMEVQDDEEEEVEADGAGKAAEGAEPPFDAETVRRDFEATYAELRRWVDPAGEGTIHLHIRREWRQGRLGEVLRLLQEQVRKHPTDASWQRKRIAVLRALGWSDWVELERAWMKVRFPRADAEF